MEELAAKHDGTTFDDLQSIKLNVKSLMNIQGELKTFVKQSMVPV